MTSSWLAKNFDALNFSDETRPDRRISSPEILALRGATRALRLHIDQLPIDYTMDAPAGQFFAELAFSLARNSYDCAESMIGAGFGGAVVGSIARSLFLEGLRWRWVCESPQVRTESLLARTLEERSRILGTIDSNNSRCANIAFWFTPLGKKVDLFGVKPNWLSAEVIPDDHTLLEGVIRNEKRVHTAKNAEAGVNEELAELAWKLATFPGVMGAASVLKHAGHGNQLGLQSCLTEDRSFGHDLRPDHEALFMQLAAVGVVNTLVGYARAIPHIWPPEVPMTSFVTKAIELATDVSNAASLIHGLSLDRSSWPTKRSRRAAARVAGPLHSQAFVRVTDFRPGSQDASEVIGAVDRFAEFTFANAIDLANYPPPKLATIMAIGGAYSNLEAVISTYQNMGSFIIAAHASRMLLEEAARFFWMTSALTDEERTKRIAQYFGEYRYRRRKAINRFASDGVSRPRAQAFFAPPAYVKEEEKPKPRGGYERLPNLPTILKNIGGAYPDPGWLVVAYSLLSQVTHCTTIGYSHLVKYDDNGVSGVHPSTELLSLVLDVSCMASAKLIGASTVILTQGSEDSFVLAREMDQSAMRVHNTAKKIHGLG